jgi:phospholipid-binding lipoprotein MlaA
MKAWDVKALLRLVFLTLCMAALTACSTVTKVQDKAQQTIVKIGEKTNIGQNPVDPLEGMNRKVFDFNEGLDEYVLKPTAKFYQAVTPNFIQIAVSNFFGNAGDVWTAVNNFLQGNGKDGVHDVLRVTFNSTIGLVGLIDVASEMGIPKHRADFGQTLGRWGVPSGPYIVLPLFGASTLRDTLALPVDFKGDVINATFAPFERNAFGGLKVVDKRVGALDAVSLIEEAALDKYVFIRDAYMQRRESQIKVEKEDGEVEVEKEVKEKIESKEKKEVKEEKIDYEELVEN